MNFSRVSERLAHLELFGLAAIQQTRAEDGEREVWKSDTCMG